MSEPGRRSNKPPSSATIANVMKVANLQMVGPYETSKLPIECTCLLCGKTIHKSYNHISASGFGCSDCRKRNQVRKPRLAQEVVQSRLLEKNLRTDEQISTVDQVFEAICLSCGTPLETSIHRLKRIKGCKACNKGTSVRMPVAEALQIMEEAGFQPLEEFRSVNEKWKCKCTKCGKVSSPSLKTVKNSGARCRFCRGLRLSEEDAIADLKSVGLTPMEAYVSSNTPWKCKCNSCGRETTIKHSKAKHRGQGCSYCNEVRPLDDLDLLSIEIEQAGYKLLNPLTRVRGSNKAIHVLCGRTVEINTTGFKKGIGQCKWCASNAPIDHETAQEIMVNAGYVPQEPFKTNASKWNSIHLNCGNSVAPTLKQIKAGKGGCRYCANWGFNYGDLANVYLITHNAFGAHKIGISNPNKDKSVDRITRHKKNGWQVVKVWNFKDGKSAHNIETEVFRHLRKVLSIGPYLSKSDMTHDGHTETINAQEIEIQSLIEIVEVKIRELRVKQTS